MSISVCSHPFHGGPVTIAQLDDRFRGSDDPRRGVAALVPHISRLDSDLHMDELQHAVLQNQHVRSLSLYMQMVVTNDGGKFVRGRRVNRALTTSSEPSSAKLPRPFPVDRPSSPDHVSSC